MSNNLYALLIGIDCYLPNRLPDGSCYGNLGGSVRDIHSVEAFLKDHRRIDPDQILKFTATSCSQDEAKPIEPPDQLPTYQNIVNAFRTLGDLAPAGSQVYIHYSGHGGRAKTIYPEVKGETGIDEGLVPTDIGIAGQYVRDLELALLLKELVDQNLVVTLILDCCHSGGATRGDAEIRGIDAIDDRPHHNHLAPIETLTEHWRSLTAQSTRGLKAGGLPESNQYVVMAACREHEYAYEYAFNRETRERNGALTYWLLDTLRQQNPGRTYKDLYDRINAQIHSQFPQQTPILLGQSDRAIFGSERSAIAFTIPVMKVEQTETGEVQAILSVGQSNGITKGAEFAIYPRGTTDFTQKAERIAIAKLIQRGSTESLCQLAAIDGKPLKVEPGDQAVQIAVAMSLIRKVSLMGVSEQQDAIKAAIARSGWVELDETVSADDHGEPVNFIVAVNNSEYEICPGGSAEPFKNIKPALRIDDPAAPEKLVKRLVHLAKYQAAAEIDNIDTASPLTGKLTVEWLGTSDWYDAGDPIPKSSQLKPLSDPTKPAVKVGEYIFLSIRNNSPQTLNIAVLNFEADWAIEQIHPHTEQFITLEPGREEKIPLQASIEGSDSQIENTIKVFATVGIANFRYLELPSLDHAIVPKSITRSGGLLDQLLSAIGAEQPATRKLTVAASPSREWTTKRISLTITK